MATEQLKECRDQFTGRAVTSLISRAGNASLARVVPIANLNETLSTGGRVECHPQAREEDEAEVDASQEIKATVIDTEVLPVIGRLQASWEVVTPRFDPNSIRSIIGRFAFLCGCMHGAKSPTYSSSHSL